MQVPRGTTQRLPSRIGAGRQGNIFSFQSREKNALDIPSYRSGVFATLRLPFAFFGVSAFRSAIKSRRYALFIESQAQPEVGSHPSSVVRRAAIRYVCVASPGTDGASAHHRHRSHEYLCQPPQQVPPVLHRSPWIDDRLSTLHREDVFSRGSG